MNKHFSLTFQPINCAQHRLQIEYVCTAPTCDKRVFCDQCLSQNYRPTCNLTRYREFFLQDLTPELKEKFEEAEGMSSQAQKYIHFLKQLESCMDQLKTQFLANLLSLQEQLKNQILQTNPDLPAIDQYQHFKKKIVEAQEGLSSMDLPKLQSRIEEIIENRRNLLRSLEDFHCTEEGVSTLAHIDIAQIPFEKVNLLTSTVCSQINDFFNGLAGNVTSQIANSPDRRIARNPMILSARGTPNVADLRVPNTHIYTKLLTGDIRRTYTGITSECESGPKQTAESSKSPATTLYNDVDNIDFTPLSYRSGIRQEDDSIYWGQWKGGRKHGKGKIFYKDGRCYEGYWKDDLQHGQGKMVHPDKDSYEGSWRNGKAHGFGMYVSHKGWSYEGDWVEDRIEGKGEQKYASGDLYQGEFFKGLRHGKGTLVFADKEAYKGDFARGEFNGIGEYIYKDGTRYIGEWKDNQRNGKGKLYVNKLVYEGNWKNDKLEGAVVVKSRSGAEHVLEMHSGKMLTKNDLSGSLICK